MILRDYQLRAIDQVRAAFRATRAVLLVLPTGGGKTATSSQLMAWAVARGRRCLFLVHRREIVQDTHRRLLAAGVSAGVVMAGAEPSDAPVQVCSVQTVAARQTHPTADLVVWDEAHHVAAETYQAIRAQYPDAWHLGLTATPERADGRPLGDAFGALVAPVTVRELVDAGHLAPIEVLSPDRRLVRSLARDPVEALQTEAPGRPALIFAHSVEASQGYAARLPRAAHLDGTTPRDERTAILARFESGEIDTISNVAVLTEGWDSARAEVCVLARGCGSLPVYLQAIGRVRRTGGRSDKRCLLIDLSGASLEWGHPDDDRSWRLDRGQRQIAREACEAEREPEDDPAEVPERDRSLLTLGLRLHDLARLRAAAARLTEDARRQQYRHLRRLAEARGYRPGWAAVQYARRYGDWPPRQWSQP